MLSSWLAALGALAAALAVDTAVAGDAGLREAVALEPEIASGYAHHGMARGERIMAVTAHPAATDAAFEVLARGGNVADAAVAAQMVLNVVEPQSSGIGGGALLLHYDAASGRVEAWDGRETAPAAADPDYLRYVAGEPGRPVVPNARQSGRSVGVPGLVAVLEAFHREHGREPWEDLFAPAIALARDGFPVSARLAASIAQDAAALARDPEAAAHFLGSAGRPPEVGATLYSLALADTLGRVAREGAAAFYAGDIARDVVEQVRRPPNGATPGAMTLADLQAYRPVRRQPVCAPYRRWEVCGFPPPSSGGIAVLQILGILAGIDLSALPPTHPGEEGGEPDPLAVHWVTEASRLAYADRNRYVADTDFVPLPGGSPAALLDPAYLARRAAAMNAAYTMGRARPGLPSPVEGDDTGSGLPETTHLSLVDADGNALSMTSTIEGAFGSFMMVRGFLLNNELTDFSFRPADTAGRPIANRVEGGKRPRSSMAPTLVFERGEDGTRGGLVMVTGSPGGAAIIQFVAQQLIAVLDWGLDAGQAVAMMGFGALNTPETILEAGHVQGGRELERALNAIGHEVAWRPRTSGLATIVVERDAGGAVLTGAADPRREGRARGG